EGVGVWNAVRQYPLRIVRALPKPYHSTDPSDQTRYDRVAVRIDAEPLTSTALFAIAPYHTLEGGPRRYSGRSDEQVIHRQGRWLLSRIDSSGIWMPRRVEYRFGTHAFHDGIQTRFLRYL